MISKAKTVLKAHSKHLRQAKGIQDFLKKEHDGDDNDGDDDMDDDDDEEDDDDDGDDDDGADDDDDLVREGSEAAGVFQVFHENRLTVLVIFCVQLHLSSEHDGR